MCDLMFDCDAEIRKIRAENCSKAAFLASAGVVRNRSIANNKSHRYSYRVQMDRFIARYEDMIVEQAESIMKELGV